MIRHPSTAALGTALTLSSAALPSLAQDARDDAVAPVTVLTAPATPDRAGGRLTEPLGAPAREGGREIVFVGHFGMEESAVRAAGIATGAKVAEGTRVLLAGATIKSERTGPQDNTVLVSLEAPALTLIDFARDRLRQERDVVLIGYGVGEYLVLGAVRRIAEELQAEHPRQWREKLAKVHVVFVGDMGREIDGDLRTQLPDGVGSAFRLWSGAAPEPNQPLDPHGDYLQRYLPHLEPRMFEEWGELALEQFTPPATRPNALRAAEERVVRSKAEVARQELRRIEGIVEQARLVDSRQRLESTIDGILEDIRILDYRLNDIENRQVQAGEDLAELSTFLDSLTSRLRRIERRQSEVHKQLDELGGHLRRALSELVQFVITRPREPTTHRFTMKTDRLAANADTDFDGDGVSNELEELILTKCQPILALHADDNPLPISATEFLRRSTVNIVEIDLQDRHAPSPLEDAVMYGRVCQPDAYKGTPYYVAQYYMLYAWNETRNHGLHDLATGVNIGSVVAGAALSTALIGVPVPIGVDVDLDVGDHGAPGNHEGDWSCVDLTIDASNPKKPRIVYATLHNHGRQIFTLGKFLDMKSGRPVVYAEYGAQELHPNAGGEGEDGLSKRSTTNKHLDRFMGDEDMVVKAHAGGLRLESLDLWNVGEVDTDGAVNSWFGDVHGLADASHAMHIDERRFAEGSKEKRRQDEARFLLEYPGTWGNTNYRIKVDVGIPFTPFKKKIAEHRTTSPRGPVFNSAEERPEGISGKKWLRNHEAGDSPFSSDYSLSATFSIARAANGNTLSWDPIPYARAYLVVITAPNGETEYVIPGYRGELSLGQYTMHTRYEHDVKNGFIPGTDYKYTVQAITSNELLDLAER